ncbi:MAG: hypothetical protein LQ352_005175 [Teloschistes flavicans]|nr:MAG: hypothetical protein LQ352_005175 [Teloschistes flavicans]
MVLETSSMTDSFDTIPDTPDPYDSNTPTISTESLKSEIERFQGPRPAPIVGPLFGFTSSHRAKFFAARLELFRQTVGRNASDQERQAMLFHQSKSVRYMSYGLPITCGMGLYRAWRTRDTYRIPVYGSAISTSGWFDGKRLRIMGQTILQGDSARRFVHLSRTSIYFGYAYVLGSLLVESFAVTSMSVGELLDPRLKDYQDALKAKREVDSKRPQAQSKPRDPTGQGDTSMTELWTKHRRGIGAKDIGTVDDDASPSAGTEDFYGTDAESSSGGSNMGIMSDAQMRTQERRQQVSSERSPTENRAATFQMDKVARQPDGFGDDADDASPTAQSKTPESRSGSAWDRIRKQAQTGSPGTGPRGQRWDALQKEQQRGSTTGDSFTFSSTDQDRELAKNEAQDEFDARVEKERQGGSFDDRRGKRW